MLHLSSLFGLAGVTYDYTTGNGTSGGSMSGAAAAALYIPLVLLVIFIIVALWKVFQKAGKPGWAAIVPIYNTWVLFEITGFPGWWAILSLVPFVSIFPAVVAIIATFRLAKLFGKGTGFGLGLIFLPFIFFPILGFGKATFQGTAPVTAGSSESAHPAASTESSNPAEPAASEIPTTTPAPVAPEAQPPQNDQQPPQTPAPPAV